MENVNPNPRVLFLQKSTKINLWFENVMTTVLIDQPETHSNLMRIKSELENEQSKHEESWNFIRSLLEPYPMLLMGISVFLVPDACYEIPPGLLIEWRDKLKFNGFVINEAENLTMQNLYPHKLPNDDRLDLFMWFMGDKAEFEAARLESYERVLLKRYSKYKAYFTSSTQSPPQRQHINSMCREAIHYVSQAVEKLSGVPDIKEQFCFIFARLINKSLSVEEVCKEMFALLRNDRVCITILINFNNALPYLTYREFLGR